MLIVPTILKYLQSRAQCIAPNAIAVHPLRCNTLHPTIHTIAIIIANSVDVADDYAMLIVPTILKYLQSRAMEWTPPFTASNVPN